MNFWKIDLSSQKYSMRYWVDNKSLFVFNDESLVTGVEGVEFVDATRSSVAAIYAWHAELIQSQNGTAEQTGQWSAINTTNSVT